MRIALTAVAALLAAIPASAQSTRDVLGPRTLTPNMVACTDLPVTALPEPRLVVKGGHTTDGRAMVTRGAEVMIGRTPGDGFAAGQSFTVRRVKEDYKIFPGEPTRGYANLQTVGYITVTSVDENNARATIDYACVPIQGGDFLVPYAEPTVPSTAGAMLYPDFNDRARVLEGTEFKALFADGDTLSIDRGTAHGATVGARFAIYRDWRDGVMPLVHVGDIVLVEIGETTSKGVVINSIDAVRVDDVAVPRTQKFPRVQ
jgi:hypothetical protein